MRGLHAHYKKSKTIYLLKKDCYANILLGSGRVEWLIRVTLTQCLSLTVWTGGKNDKDKAATASHALVLSQSGGNVQFRVVTEQIGS